MFGTAHTDEGKNYLQLTTSDARVPELINFINTHNNNKYDYPVPDVIVEPVQDGNEEFLAWVGRATKEGSGFDYDEPESESKANTGGNSSGDTREP